MLDRRLEGAFWVSYIRRVVIWYLKLVEKRFTLMVIKMEKYLYRKLNSRAVKFSSGSINTRDTPSFKTTLQSKGENDTSILWNWKEVDLNYFKICKRNISIFFFFITEWFWEWLWTLQAQSPNQLDYLNTDMITTLYPFPPSEKIKLL